MLEDCKLGKIDIILTKSISRFARNTVNLLETTRLLRDMGIEVRFEKENINSLSGDGELMLSILASFAQEESRSISENIKWATKKRFEKGIPNGRVRVYGYTWIDNQLVINHDEAEVVRTIYHDYLTGASRIEIGKKFDSMGIKTRLGYKFVDANIKVILTNITYTGNMLFQKEYVADPITKKRKKNRGELPQYYVENTHEAIISKTEFDKVQAEMERRKNLGVFGNKSLNLTCFSTKIKCEICGCSFHRSTRIRTNGKCKVWVCGNRKAGKPHDCEVKDIPEDILQKVSAAVMGISEFDAEIFENTIEKIVVPSANILIFHLYNGTIVEKTWVSTARVDCWTEERRKAWGEYQKGNKHANNNKGRWQKHDNTNNPNN